MKDQKNGLFFVVLLVIAIFSNCSKEQPLPEKCSLHPDSGLCKAAFRKYYYDKEEKRCKEFIWGGCGGSVPFETLEECRECECHE